jgi:hypothetical protein
VQGAMHKMCTHGVGYRTLHSCDVMGSKQACARCACVCICMVCNMPHYVVITSHHTMWWDGVTSRPACVGEPACAIGMCMYNACARHVMCVSGASVQSGHANVGVHLGVRAHQRQHARVAISQLIIHRNCVLRKWEHGSSLDTCTHACHLPWS